jgi:hypothetical protein
MVKRKPHDLLFAQCAIKSTRRYGFHESAQVL